MKGLLSMVHISDNDIGMELSKGKCTKTTFIRSMLTSTGEIEVDERI